MECKKSKLYLSDFKKVVKKEKLIPFSREEVIIILCKLFKESNLNPRLLSKKSMNILLSEDRIFGVYWDIVGYCWQLSSLLYSNHTSDEMIVFSKAPLGWRPHKTPGSEYEWRLIKVR